jgi:hypothetical protein
VGEYNHEAEDLHYAGGELLDAFAFANVDIGETTSLGIRAGRHTIYWGQGLLTNGAIHGIGGAMAPIDFTKALSVPGSEAKELFMPTGKISSVLQLGANLTLNAYYSYEFQAYRMPEDGTYWSPVEGLTENSEFLTLLPGGLSGRASKCVAIQKIRATTASICSITWNPGHWTSVLSTSTTPTRTCMALKDRDNISLTIKRTF